MPQKAIREFNGKSMLAGYLNAPNFQCFAQVSPRTNLDDLVKEHPWLQQCSLVAKPDQLIKRRGKAGLLSLNQEWKETRAWIEERRGRPIEVEGVCGVLDHFLVEPFLPHKQSDEYYVCIHTLRGGDEILFYHEGGVDVGDVDSKAARLVIEVDSKPSSEQLAKLVAKVDSEKRQQAIATFIGRLYDFFVSYHFSYLEINPIVVTDDLQVTCLDMAAKIDECAKYLCAKRWGAGLHFPPPFGRPLSPEEEYIAELDSKTGASLKLTILNPKGRVWTMVAGGGASVIYADTLGDLGAGAELANYGEYSGAPSQTLTYEYAATVLKLMLRPHSDSSSESKTVKGKILIIGGGIANFTNVADTFKGIIQALTRYSKQLIDQKVRIFVRRGGPNYQQGLQMMRALRSTLSLDISVYGPDDHMTSIVSRALGMPIKSRLAKHVPRLPVEEDETTGGVSRSASTNSLQNFFEQPGPDGSDRKSPSPSLSRDDTGAREISAPNSTVTRDTSGDGGSRLFTPKTRAIIYGLQLKAVQNMLDFDYICERKDPSVAALVYPFSSNYLQKFYWNTKEMLIPVYEQLAAAVQKFPEVDTVVNFASFRSVYDSTVEMMQFPQIKTIAIIAEGVPERLARSLNRIAKEKGVTLIGPATVGGIAPGAFRIGNTGGMLDNIISSRLYRPGSVAYVARSGGMSNEMNNIISRNADGVYEGIAIGGDMYPGTTFVDHLLRYQSNLAVKMMVVLGEVGGVEEYEIIRLIEEKRLTKPIVAWCIGTCASLFPYEVQFGHAGACAGSDKQTATAKNAALKAAGCTVPASFEEFGVAINRVYSQLVENGQITVLQERPPPRIPVDYEWARKLGLVRKQSQFISSIVDERGEELIYAGMKISDIFSKQMGIGGVVGLIWFRRRLPDYFCRFIEMVLVVTADHGPAVSGAHNTIVCARAGKDLVSSLASGLLTIGPRFGGALDGAARIFSWAYDAGMEADEFVNHMRAKKQLIMGIGHKVKSLENPDARVVIITDFVRKYFKNTEVFDFAKRVEAVTTKKKSNLILNVDGAIACAFVDLLRNCGAFTRDEAREYLEMGVLNGLFVLGRSIGFIGHFIDQKRLKQGLYRHPTEDISYVVDSNISM